MFVCFSPTGKQLGMPLSDSCFLVGTESKYKFLVKPRECVDVSKFSNRLLQSAFDACLKTTTFQGFSIHHLTNSVSVWVRSLADVDRLPQLRSLPVTADCTVQVQAYFSSGSDLRQYVVSRVDPGELWEDLAAVLTCSTHKIGTARYMGRGLTFLVTLQGPRTPPSRITYYGFILQFHVYTPGVAARELPKVTSSLDIASDIHRLIYSCACPIHVLWARRYAPAQLQVDAACHPVAVQHPLPLLRLSPKDSLLVNKEIFQHSTRALIPSRGSDLPGGLTPREEVSHKRIHMGAALTAAIRATWTSGAQPPPTTCPF
ncbi:hypothetical protein HPB51_015134 [Rhipicephalus microplus]|uniref:Uncharacterized protein n=1 Tax=Rhipicephalus microplus TaxID=6941 RepID=A0A9J6DNM4_RHIMP|nr:hypothetical protein HPB51_015134 [Rhipicephalus microplus]